MDVKQNLKVEIEYKILQKNHLHKLQNENMQSSFSTIKQMYNDGFQKMNRFCLLFFDYYAVLHVFGWYRKLY